MEDKEDVHPVVDLMLKRMESHPEEFMPSPHLGRWGKVLDRLNDWGNAEDKRLLDAKLRDVAFEQAHKEALDELLNGEERRQQEQQTAKVAMQAQLAQAQIQQQYGTLGVGNASPYINNMSTALTNELRLGSETISEGLLKQIKGKLGL